MTDRPAIVRGRSSRTTHGTPSVASTTANVETDLGRATDQLNASFEEVERRLKKLGIFGSVPLEISDPGDDFEHSLSFQKRGGRWQLLHVVIDSFGDERDATPLTSEPRWVRVLAAKALGTLVTQLRARAEEELRSVHGALAAVNDVLGTLPAAEDRDDAADEKPSDSFGDGVPF